MTHYSYPMNDDRQRMVDRLDDETEASTRADAIDAAIRHSLQDKQNREEQWERFPPELLKLLNTSEMKVSYYPKVRQTDTRCRVPPKSVAKTTVSKNTPPRFA